MHGTHGAAFGTILGTIHSGITHIATTQDITHTRHIDHIRMLHIIHILTILLITHDEQIAAAAKRVVRLSDGKIVSDTLQEVDWE